MVLAQKWPFFQLLFFGNIAKENVFNDILERINAFLSFKNKKFKTLKNWHFSNGVNRWFWAKNGYFFNFYFFGNRGQENVFNDILEPKNASLSYKKKISKSRRINIFPKGLTHGFGQKNGHFSNFFF